MMIDYGMIREWPRQFATAWRFLTIIPLGREGDLSPERLGKSMAMFPTVGLVLGLTLVGLHALLSYVFPTLLVDLLVISALILMTGGLHLDGFTDSIDGLAGGRNREEILDIMRDSRVGVIGVIALILLILFKVASLNQCPERWKPGLLLCMPCMGRWSMLQMSAFSRYAREGEGTGKAFADFSGRPEYLVGFVFTSAAVFLALGLKGFLILGLIGLTTYLTTRFFEAKLGGVTGDTHGFTGELSEAVFLLLGAAVL